MTPKQQERILELRELRRIDSFTVSCLIDEASFWDIEGDHIVNVIRTLQLHIRQDQGQNKFTLYTILQIRPEPKDSEESLVDGTAHNAEEVTKAKEEFQALLEAYSPKNEWEQLNIVESIGEVACDELGLNVVANRTLQVRKIIRTEEFTDVYIRRVITVREKYLPTLSDVDDLPRKAKRDRTVRLAREDIRVAMKMMHAKEGADCFYEGRYQTAAGFWKPVRS